MKPRSIRTFFWALLAIAGLLAVALIVYAGAHRRALAASLVLAANDAGENGLTQEELVDLIKPSVVRVVQNVKIEGRVPAFKPDFAKQTIVFLEEIKPFDVDVEVPLVGSGFVVNPDGYILTNAHVVSDETIKRLVLAEVINEVVNAALDGLKKEEKEAVTADTAAFRAYGESVYAQILAKTNFKIDKKVNVVDPSGKYEKVADLVNNGFPAAVVKAGSDFMKDNRDVALIKIEASDLPALKLSKSENPGIGTKIFVFGFPVTAEFTRSSLLESTVTQGVVGALRDSFKKEFKIIQSDAKMSQGSSGGPMIDVNGDVIGIITYQTGAKLQESGDNFAFAIPARIGQEMLDDASVQNQPGNYQAHMRAGFELMRAKRCKKAIEEFELAKGTNDKFRADSYVEPYIKNCDAMITRGESVDDWWGEAREKFGAVGYVGWAIVGAGTFVFLVLLALIVILAKKMKRKEKEFNHLEDMMLEEAAKESVQRHELDMLMKQNGMAGSDASSAVFKAGTAAKSMPIPEASPAPVPEQPLTVDPRLAEYIGRSRLSGMDDIAIAAELKNSGWPETMTAAALAKNGAGAPRP
jgi:S1-C subfamily serine protease